VGAELEDSLQHWPSHQIALHTRDIDRGSQIYAHAIKQPRLLICACK
jgi:hypothetical protein